MANILIVSCQNIREKTLCPGDAKCLVAAVKEKAGVEVIEGTHEYAPKSLFG
jgi:predicted metal-binding protein